ncbi:hypothetical protein HPB50_003786 [Hyalomma asiaticum]|uniref:Uncharacterized protein n=1 Tax=Hyalomma asiaticum TaxID=266040 RepID=A0ACB7S573_HYAAI|nr:hypothetical protein HPB50_003786 [Hyalomma asiaticum]
MVGQVNTFVAACGAAELTWSSTGEHIASLPLHSSLCDVASAENPSPSGNPHYNRPTLSMTGEIWEKASNQPQPQGSAKAGRRGQEAARAQCILV